MKLKRTIQHPDGTIVTEEYEFTSSTFPKCDDLIHPRPYFGDFPEDMFFEPGDFCPHKLPNDFKPKYWY